MPRGGHVRQFQVLAFGDKFLIDDEFLYLLFFESDEPFTGAPPPYADNMSLPYRVFPTPNGFHVIAERLGDFREKQRWFDAWKARYPRSDYWLSNWNFLRPASFEEAAYILRLAPKRPRMVRYYRDKKVFENWREIQGYKDELADYRRKGRIEGGVLKHATQARL